MDTFAEAVLNSPDPVSMYGCELAGTSFDGMGVLPHASGCGHVSFTLKKVVVHMPEALCPPTWCCWSLAPDSSAGAEGLWTLKGG